VSVVLLWVSRGKRLEVMHAHCFPLNTFLMLPLAAFTPGSQAGVCCRVKPGVGLLEECALPQSAEREGAPRLSIACFISVSVLASELRSCAGRSPITQQQGSAFPRLILLIRKKKRTTPICSKKCQQM